MDSTKVNELVLDLSGIVVIPSRKKSDSKMTASDIVLSLLVTLLGGVMLANVSQWDWTQKISAAVAMLATIVWIYRSVQLHRGQPEAAAAMSTLSYNADSAKNVDTKKMLPIRPEKQQEGVTGGYVNIGMQVNNFGSQPTASTPATLTSPNTKLPKGPVQRPKQKPRTSAANPDAKSAVASSEQKVDDDKSKYQAKGATFNIQSNNQQGGVTAGIVNNYMVAQSRELTAEQRIKLIGALRSTEPKHIKLATVLGDGESEAYGSQIAQAIAASGWTVEKVQEIYVGDSVGGVTVNCNINLPTAPDPNHPGKVLAKIKDLPPMAIILNNAFVAAGLQVSLAVTPSVAPGSVELRVGHKPQ